MWAVGSLLGRLKPWWATSLLLVGGPIGGKRLLLCWLLTARSANPRRVTDSLRVCSVACTILAWPVSPIQMDHLHCPSSTSFYSNSPSTPSTPSTTASNRAAHSPPTPRLSSSDLPEPTPLGPTLSLSSVSAPSSAHPILGPHCHALRPPRLAAATLQVLLRLHHQQ